MPLRILFVTLQNTNRYLLGQNGPPPPVRGKVLVESIHPDCGEVSERNPLIIFFRFLHFLYPLVHRIYENSNS